MLFSLEQTYINGDLKLKGKSFKDVPVGSTVTFDARHSKLNVGPTKINYQVRINVGIYYLETAFYG